MAEPSKQLGRPLQYQTQEELSDAIDEYFTYCDNRMKQVHSKEGESYGIANPEPYTMSGLAYAVGLSRQALVEYSHKEAFGDTLKRARNKVEVDIERRMNDKDTFTPGLIFNAKNNFGWKDKTEVDNTVHLPKPIMDLTDVLPDDSNEES